MTGTRDLAILTGGNREMEVAKASDIQGKKFDAFRLRFRIIQS